VTTPWLELFREPAPAARLGGFRCLVGAFALFYLVSRFPGLTSVASLSAWEFSPVGAAKLLSAPLPPRLVVGAVLLALPLGALFTLGWLYRVTAPAFALLLFWVTSYRNSFGMLFHTENLLVLHVALLALTPAADGFSLDARRGRVVAVSDPPYAHVLTLACALTVATYFVAGVAKLKLGGVDWLQGEQLRGQIAYDNLRKIELGSGSSWLGIWFVRHPRLFPPLAVLTLVIELGAPLVLLSRRVALAWALGAWAFHVGVAALMNITFPYPLSGIPYLAFFRIERWPSSPWLRRWRGRPD
jgi:Vitamin K-dependent gamma-carboxylase